MKDIIEKTTKILKKDGIILYPTDTVWGIGCDAKNQKAIDKIQKLKARSNNKSFIILIDKIEKLDDYVVDFPEIAVELIKSYDKPLTIVFQKGKNVAPNVMNSDGSIAIRVVKNAFCEQLIAKLGTPIVSTSANISGEKAPVMFSEISEKIIKGVDFVVRFDQEISNEVKASTMIKFINDTEFVVLRD